MAITGHCLHTSGKGKEEEEKARIPMKMEVAVEAVTVRLHIFLWLLQHNCYLRLLLMSERLLMLLVHWCGHCELLSWVIDHEKWNACDVCARSLLARWRRRCLPKGVWDWKSREGEWVSEWKCSNDGSRNNEKKRYKLRLNGRKMDVFVADDADNCDDALEASFSCAAATATTVAKWPWMMLTPSVWLSAAVLCTAVNSGQSADWQIHYDYGCNCPNTSNSSIGTDEAAVAVERGERCLHANIHKHKPVFRVRWQLTTTTTVEGTTEETTAKKRQQLNLCQNLVSAGDANNKQVEKEHQRR